MNIKKLCAAVSLLMPFSAVATELTDGGVELSSWSLGSTHSFTTTGANVRTGATALALVSDGSTATTFHDLTPMAAGTEYCLTAFVKSEGIIAAAAGETPILGIQHRQNGAAVASHSGSGTEGYRWAPFESDGTYEYTDQGMMQCGQVLAAANQVRVFARSWFTNSLGQTGGSTYWDDFQLTLRSFPDRGALLTTIQAESQTIVDASIKTDEFDYRGSGYVEIDAADGAGSIVWTATQTGDLIYSVRYTREGSRVGLRLFVDGVQADYIRNATPTGRQYIYASADLKANVSAGQTIELQVERNGGVKSQPFIDEISVYTDLNPATPPPPTPTSENLFDFNADLLICGLVSYVKCAPVLSGSIGSITGNSANFTPSSDQPVVANDTLNAVYYRLIGANDPLPSGFSLRTENANNCGVSCSIDQLVPGTNYSIAAVHFKDYRYSNVARFDFATTGSTASAPELCPAPTLAANQAAGLASEVSTVLGVNDLSEATVSIEGLTTAQALEVSNNGGFLPVEMTDIDMTGGTILSPQQNHANMLKWLRRAENANVILDLGSGGVALVDGQVWINRVNNQSCKSSSRHDLVGMLIGDPNNHPTIKLVDAPTDPRFSNASNPVPFVILTTSSGNPDAIPACNLGGNVNKTVTINDWTGKLAPANGFHQYIRHVNIDTGSGAGNTKRGTFALSSSTAQYAHVIDVDITVDRAYACLGRGPGRGGMFADGSCTNLNNDTRYGFADNISVEGNSGGATANTLRDWRFYGSWTQSVYASEGRIALTVFGGLVSGQDLSVAPVWRSDVGGGLVRSSIGAASFVDLVVNVAGASATAANPFPVMLNDFSGGRMLTVRSMWADGLQNGKPLITSGTETIVYDSLNKHVIEYAYSHKDTLSAAVPLRTTKLEYDRVPARNIVDGVVVGNSTIFSKDSEPAPADVGKSWSMRFNNIGYIYHRDPLVANFTRHGCVTNRGSRDVTADVQNYLDSQYAAGTRKFMFGQGTYWIEKLHVPANAVIAGGSIASTMLVSIDAAAAGLDDGDFYITTDNDTAGTCGLQDIQLIVSAQDNSKALGYVDFGCGRGHQHAIRAHHYPAGKAAGILKKDFTAFRINATGGGWMSQAAVQRFDRFSSNSIPLLIENTQCSTFNGIANIEHMDSEVYTVVRNACNVFMGPFKHETAESALRITNSDNIMFVEWNGIGATATATPEIGSARVDNSNHYELLSGSSYTFSNFTIASQDAASFIETVNGQVTVDERLSQVGPYNYPIIRRGFVDLSELRLH